MSAITLSRRKLLRVVAGSAALSALPARGNADAGSGIREYRLEARPATVPLAGDGHPDTAVWSYNASVPGPELRVRRGERLRVVVHNGLTQETTVHWHGLRIPNAMDGVPGLTQPPIPPGGSFSYEFTPPDAGTFWYHPHVRGFEQVERGLAGALVVVEEAPPAVDRDVTWVLDDWRLDRQAAIREDFGNRHDASHAGRLGNAVTVNGRIMEAFTLRAGERIRLRLVNVANARSFALSFDGHRPHVVAIDGQPVPPHEPPGGRVVLGAAMRVDLLLDCDAAPGTRAPVSDSFFPRRSFQLTELRYSSDAPLRGRGDRELPSLEPNPLPEPDLDRARWLDLTLGGGAMGGMRGAVLDGNWTDMRTLARSGLMWAMNGTVRRADDFSTPMLEAPRGSSHRIALRNRTAFPHPMHLHGHHFRVLSRDSRPVPHRPWQDTVLVMPREEVEIAFRADNPGDWLFHCHVLEHMAAGMTGLVRVL